MMKNAYQLLLVAVTCLPPCSFGHDNAPNLMTIYVLRYSDCLITRTGLCEEREPFTAGFLNWAECSVISDEIMALYLKERDIALVEEPICSAETHKPFLVSEESELYKRFDWRPPAWESYLEHRNRIGIKYIRRFEAGKD